MGNDLCSPLVRWDGLHLVVDLEKIEERLQRYLLEVENISAVRVSGEADALRIVATIVWKGLRVRVAIELTEIRLRYRRAGFRIRRVRAFNAVTVPRSAIEAILRRVGSDLVTVLGGEGIVIVDLRQWIPPELSLSLLTVQATDRALHIWLGPGEMRDLPPSGPQELTAGNNSGQAATMVPVAPGG